MPSVTPPLLIEHSRKLGQQSASQTLKAIAKVYPGKLFCTLSLVALENALLLAYPLFAGFAVEAMLRGDAGNALFYAAVVLGFWVVGAARRALDTRTFTRIYADLAVPVILNQRLQNPCPGHQQQSVARRHCGPGQQLHVPEPTPWESLNHPLLSRESK